MAVPFPVTWGSGQNGYNGYLGGQDLGAKGLDSYFHGGFHGSGDGQSQRKTF